MQMAQTIKGEMNKKIYMKESDLAVQLYTLWTDNVSQDVAQV